MYSLLSSLCHMYSVLLPLYRCIMYYRQYFKCILFYISPLYRCILYYRHYVRCIVYYRLYTDRGLRGRVFDSRLRGCWFEPHQNNCVVSLSIYVLKRVSFGSKGCTKELKLECAYFLGQTS